MVSQDDVNNTALVAPSPPPLSTHSWQHTINAELFIVHLSLYDARYLAKVSETFTWIPNFEMYLNQSSSSSKKTCPKENNEQEEIEVESEDESERMIFSLNGKSSLARDEEKFYKSKSYDHVVRENLFMKISQVNMHCLFI